MYFSLSLTLSLAPEVLQSARGSEEDGRVGRGGEVFGSEGCQRHCQRFQEEPQHVSSSRRPFPVPAGPGAAPSKQAATDGAS